MKNLMKRAGVVAGLGAVAAPSFAAVDLTGITGAFTASDIVTGVLAVGAVLATVYVTIKGAKTVLGMIRG